MKKIDAIKLNARIPIIVHALQDIERRGIYILIGDSRFVRDNFKNIPILVTHFHKTGIRCKVLANRPLSDEYFKYEDMGTFMGKDFTIPYEWLQLGVRFQKMNPDDLINYINCPTKHLAEGLSGIVQRELIPNWGRLSSRKKSLLGASRSRGRTPRSLHLLKSLRGSKLWGSII